MYIVLCVFSGWPTNSGLILLLVCPVCFKWCIHTCDHDWCIHVTWLEISIFRRCSRMYDISYPYVCHKSFMCDAKHSDLIHARDMTPIQGYSLQMNSWKDSWLLVPHSLRVCHETFKCLTLRVQMCDMTHSNVWHDSFKCVAWLIHIVVRNHNRKCDCMILFQSTRTYTQGPEKQMHTLQIGE